MKPRTLLGVWAHPDDEAYLSAGLMVAARRRGDRVVVVTATLGELGTADPGAWPPDKLAAERHRELRNSLAALDVHELHVLGYPDGGCAAQDRTEAIAGLIESVGPDLIVTFGPDGLTGHPDHRAVGGWTTDAWAATGSPAALWYPTVTADFHRRWGRVNERVGFWMDRRYVPTTARAELVHHVALPAADLDLKIAALEAHTTQTRPIIDLIGPTAYREWWRTESFRAGTRASQQVA